MPPGSPDTLDTPPPPTATDVIGTAASEADSTSPNLPPPPRQHDLALPHIPHIPHVNSPPTPGPPPNSTHQAQIEAASASRSPPSPPPQQASSRFHASSNVNPRDAADAAGPRETRRPA